jgi:hypothetical protein
MAEWEEPIAAVRTQFFWVFRCTALPLRRNAS